MSMSSPRRSVVATVAAAALVTLSLAACGDAGSSGTAAPPTASGAGCAPSADDALVLLADDKHLQASDNIVAAGADELEIERERLKAESAPFAVNADLSVGSVGRKLKLMFGAAAAGDAGGDRLQAADHDPRNTRDSRGNLDFRHQNSAGQTVDRDKRA